MTKFKKKPVVIEAITFQEFVQFAKENTESPHWSIPYQGVNISHENDECYLIPTLEGLMKFTPNDMLITGVKGEVYPCKKDIFEVTYEKVTEETSDKDFNGLLKVGKGTFGMAIEAAKQGFKVARVGWNGKCMFAFMVNGSKFKVSRAPLNEIYPEGTEVEYRPHIDLKAADGTIGVWNPNMMDILAEDWIIV